MSRPAKPKEGATQRTSIRRPKNLRPLAPLEPLNPLTPLGGLGPLPPLPPLPSRRAMRSAPILEETATGDAILALARTRIGQPYVLGARAPMGDADWRGPWDCAEFASWCVYQATGMLFGVEPRTDPIRADAFTGYWAMQARAAGATVSVEQAAGIAGALLLREPQSGRTGHIAISDGVGGTVEAHSSNDGVIAGKAGERRWDMGILVPGVRYFANATPVAVAPPPAGILRLTEPMLRGDTVAELQRCLTDLGYDPGAINGVFGPQTEAAVAEFQAASGLAVDGEVGPRTRAAILATKKCRGKP